MDDYRAGVSGGNDGQDVPPIVAQCGIVPVQLLPGPSQASPDQHGARGERSDGVEATSAVTEERSSRENNCEQRRKELNQR